ncbi:MAG: ComEC/Rec2 family competence protein [Steroidobacteraceae bacterium]
MFSIEMLRANEGDALWVEYGDPAAPKRILIDCGYKSTYREILERLDADAALAFELFVLTHIDADHIAGAVPFIADARVTPQRIGEVWFNGRKHLSDKLGVEQAEHFTHSLAKRKFRWNTAFGEKAIVVDDVDNLPQHQLAGGMRITLLSPGREQLRALHEHWTDELDDVLTDKNVRTVDQLLETTPKRLQPDVLGKKGPNVTKLAAQPFNPDDTVPNGSSIAFLAEYRDDFDGGKEKAVLFLGDAHAPVVAKSIAALLRKVRLDRLRLDACKLSHHGSTRNTSKDLLALLDCKHFLVSTNGVKHDHPDQECIARVLAQQRSTPVHLHFNYESDFNRMWKPDPVQKDHRYTAHYPPDDRQGLRVTL